MYKLKVEETFSAAHQLCDYDGPCENLHGHTFKIEVLVSGTELDKVGMLVDFKVLKEVLKEERDKLDHTFLNDVLDFSPTSERLAKYLYEKMESKLPHNANLDSITIWESPTTCASYSK